MCPGAGRRAAQPDQVAGKRDATWTACPTGGAHSRAMPAPPGRLIACGSVHEIRMLTRAARRRGLGARVPGTGHPWTGARRDETQAVVQGHSAHLDTRSGVVTIAPGTAAAHAGCHAPCPTPKTEST